MKKPKTIALCLLALLAVAVGLQNSESVETRILFWTLTMSRALLLCLTFVAGALAGLGLGLWLARGRKSRAAGGAET